MTAPADAGASPDAAERGSAYGAARGAAISQGLFVGIDCGGTHLRIAAADSAGAIRVERTVPTEASQRGPGGLGGAIAELVEAILPELGASGERILGLGVGLPFVCWDGRVHLHRNVDALDPGALESTLARIAGAPVSMSNDVKCAALGEAWLGAARGADPFVYLNVGTGLSAALYAGGRVYQGAHNAAGEIAYWATEPGDAPALADGLGALEETVSGVGLSGAYRALSKSGEQASARDIFERAAGGEALAAAVVERAVSYLLPAVANILTFADPELLVIGGGVAEGLVRFADRIEAYVGRVTPFPPRIDWAKLGRRAGLLGAVRLGIEAAGMKTCAAPSVFGAAAALSR